MIGVAFEVLLDAEERATYLDLAAELRPRLDAIDGFLSIERFQSLADPNKMLSLSFWRDEEAVAAWRTMEAHRAAQAIGRGGLFRDYRLRVVSVIRDYGLHDRTQAPQASGAPG
jgi:heme-degrading monooxygenase HmoA